MAEQWERVTDDTHRLRVPGGWLYRYGLLGLATMAFVPDQQTSAGAGRGSVTMCCGCKPYIGGAGG